MKKILNNKAFRTFIQAFIGSIVVIAPTIDYSASSDILRGSLTTLFISAISAGIAAVMNIGNMNSKENNQNG